MELNTLAAIIILLLPYLIWVFLQSVKNATVAAEELSVIDSRAECDWQ